MLDIGWTEVLVISVVVLFVVGPRDIPKVLRTVGQWTGRIRALAQEFRESVDDAMREAELDEVRKTVEAARSGFRNEIRSTIDPGGELSRSLEDVRVPPDEPTKATESAETEPGDAAPSPAPRPPSRPPTAPVEVSAAPAPAPATPPSEDKETAPRPVGLRHLGGTRSTPGSEEA